MKKYVSYRDFGAIGDGVTNDFFAMKAAHDYANEKGLPVKGEPGDTYLISDKEKNGTAESIYITTDTDWCGATIILDDTNISWVPDKGSRNYNTSPFIIKSDYAPVLLPQSVCDAINAGGGIKNNNLKKIETGLGYPAMLVLSNPDQKVFIRYGVNEDQGSGQRELVVVDKDGNIDPSTPFMFDFDKVDSIRAYRIDDKPITVENAIFHSKASRVNLETEYHAFESNIVVNRSNTTVRNLFHKITGELNKYEVVDKDSNPLPGYTCDWKTRVVRDPEGNVVTDGSAKGFIGHSYGGFVTISYAANVLVNKVTFQARMYYLQGSYDLSGGMSHNIIFRDCDQSNFLSNDNPDMPRYPGMGKWWGVGGTNFCKNITYDGCRLTRFDAHCGLVNGKIINSEVAAIRLTGAGDMHIENTKFYGYGFTIISLREDYGSTWHGTITIKDCEVYDVCNDSRLSSVVSCSSPNHWFGYPVYFPNVIVDNLKIENAPPVIPFTHDTKNAPGAQFVYRSVYDPAITTKGAICADGKENVSVHTPPEFVRVINNENNGYEFEIYESNFFKNTKIEGITVKPYKAD